MTKKFKKLSTASMAAALAASAIVPVAAAETPAAAPTVGGVVVELNGALVSVSIDVYSDLLELGKVNPTTVKYVTLSNGQNFTIAQYSDALELKGTTDATAGFLVENESIVASELTDVKEGKVENGELVPGDHTPEDKVNETFFYNLAA